MELKNVRGCVHDALLIDGKQEIDLTDEDRKMVLEKLFKSLRPSDLNYVLQELIPLFGEYESTDYPCECCGDYTETYTWVI